MIEKDKLYTLKELSDILLLTKQVVSKKIEKGEIEAKNIGTEGRKIYRIQGQNILDYLSK